MNYIELINSYWQLREQGMITGAEGDLYLYLLHTSNKLGWKNPFNQSNALIRAILNISEPTLIRHRNALKQVGLLEFESGKAVKKNTQYYLKNLSSVDSSVVSGVVSGVVSSVDEKALDNTKHKQNKTKINNKPPTPLKGDAVVPFFETYKLFHEAYEGRKDGVETTFSHYRKKHKDWDTVVPLLMPALELEIKWRKQAAAAGVFVPSWANLSTWLNQRRWEQEHNFSFKNGSNEPPKQRYVIS
jgi:hypothetical protein